MGRIRGRQRQNSSSGFSYRLIIIIMICLLFILGLLYLKVNVTNETSNGNETSAFSKIHKYEQKHKKIQLEEEKEEVDEEEDEELTIIEDIFEDKEGEDVEEDEEEEEEIMNESQMGDKNLNASDLVWLSPDYKFDYNRKDNKHWKCDNGYAHKFFDLSIRDRNKKLMLLFLHLRKTGGTTIEKIMEYEAKKRRLDYVGQGQRNKNLAYLSLIGGHFERYRHLENRRRPRKRPFTYFTILRDPVERIVSQYYYWQVIPKYRKKIVNQQGDIRFSITQFVEKGIARNNDMFRLLRRDKKDTLEDVEKQLRNTFSLVGLTERFDETLLLMKRVYNFTDVHYQKANVNYNRPPPARETLSKEEIQMIEKKNYKDMRLYKFALKLFEEEISCYGKKGEFEKDLIQFKKEQYEIESNPEQYFQGANMEHHYFDKEINK